MQTRTTKCGPISDQLSWRDRLAEYRKLEGDISLIVSLTPQERASVASALSSEMRKKIIDSIPCGISKLEFKRQLYFRTYGENLPDDYFKDEDENDG